MRIWSLHPKYLDSKGLVALWREALLAKRVLQGKTVGYKHHPQLNRFKLADNPVACMDQYLSQVYIEATCRGFNFNKDKIDWEFKPTVLDVTRGQLEYETTHLQKKLLIRDNIRYQQFRNETKMDPHTLFRIVEGGIAPWEILQKK